MARKRNVLTDEDRFLFQEAVREVKPLVHNYAVLSPPKQKKTIIKAQDDRLSSHHQHIKTYTSLANIDYIAPEEFVLEVQSGVQARLVKSMRKGRLPIDYSVDLHGLNSLQASERLVQLFQYAHHNEYRLLKVIHGKGGYLDTSRIHLKSYVVFWLKQRKDVLAFCSAASHDGGLGAVYVLLKRVRYKLNQ